MALASVAPGAVAQAKLALVVANESYATDVGDATGALASAAEVSGALATAGFDVSREQNVDRVRLEAMVNALAAKARAQAGKCTVVFYYAGHAAAISSDRSGGVLLLKNAKAATARALLEDSVPLDAVVGALATAGCAGGVFAAIDGARGNLADGLGPDLVRSLLAPGEHREAAILYSGMQGATTTNDGALGRALAKALSAPDKTMSVIFKNAVRTVADASGRRRVPYLVDNVLDPACVTCGLAVAAASTALAPVWSAKVETGRQRAGDVKQYLDADGEFDGEKFGATRIAVTPDGSAAATGYGDGAVEIWNTANGELRAAFQAADKPIYRLVWANDGSLLATATLGGPIRIWKADGAKVGDIAPGGTVSALVFDQAGQNLLVNAGLAAKRIPVGGGDATWEASLSPTDINAPVQDMMGSVPSQSAWAGERLVWATSDGRFSSIRVGEPGRGPLAPVAACAARGDGGLFSPCEPIGIAASPDGKRIAVARQAGLVSLLDGSGHGLTDSEIRVCDDPSMCHASGLVYLPVLDAFATLTFDTGLRFWNAATGKPMGGASLRGVPTDLSAYQAGGKQYVVIALYQGASVVALLGRTP